MSDRVITVNLQIERTLLNVVSAYAPQVGCGKEEKDGFWSQTEEVVESIPREERVVIGADFNGHVGNGHRGDEDVMGRYGVKERIPEGQRVVDFAKRTNMTVVNTYFRKKAEHRVTYKSGGRCSWVDYVLCRRGNLKEIGDCKVIARENVAKQHRVVVCRICLETNKRKSVRTEPKVRWWKLEEEECCIKLGKWRYRHWVGIKKDLKNGRILQKC